MEGWNLWLRPEKTLQAESKVVDLPNLWGVEEVEGLGEWQGPYPQFNAGVFARFNSGSAVFKTTKPYSNGSLQISTKFESKPGEFSIIRNGKPIHAQPKAQKATIEIPLGEVGLGEIFEISNPTGNTLRLYAFRIIEAND
jgi:hypothetical protein